MKDRETMAEVARGRAELYGSLVGTFGHLPDKDLIMEIRCGGLDDLLDRFYGLDRSRFKSGIDFIRVYHAGIEARPDEEVLAELSVDRTRILRGTSNTKLRPPYEGVYKDKKDAGASALEVKNFYRSAGLLPDDTVPEPPDYLCVELDFMRHLCRREQEQWSSHVDVGETIILEEAFLRRHLGSWIGEFCSQARKDALTDFYRGFLMILDEFVKIDKAYLHNLIAT